jgi:hypothetical protein
VKNTNIINIIKFYGSSPKQLVKLEGFKACLSGRQATHRQAINWEKNQFYHLELCRRVLTELSAEGGKDEERKRPQEVSEEY